MQRNPGFLQARACESLQTWRESRAPSSSLQGPYDDLAAVLFQSRGNQNFGYQWRDSGKFPVRLIQRESDPGPHLFIGGTVDPGWTQAEIESEMVLNLPYRA